MNPFLNILCIPSLPPPRLANVGDLVPVYGTYKDAKEFVDNPNLFNASMAVWGGVNDAVFLLTKSGGLRQLLNAGKQYVKSRAKKRALQIANPRAVARVSQKEQEMRRAVNDAKNAVLKNKKRDFVIESVDNTFQNLANDSLLPWWQKYTNNTEN